MVRAIWMLGVAGLALALLAGCGGGDGPDSMTTASGPAVGTQQVSPDNAVLFPTEPYWPIMVGNQWRYRITYFGTNGIVTSAQIPVVTMNGTTEMVSPQAVVGTEGGTLRILTAEFVDGSWWNRGRWNYYPTAPRQTIEYGKHVDTGLAWKNDPGDPFFFLLKNPLTLGNNWDVPDTMPKHREIINTNHDVVVMGQLYTNCLVVRETFLPPGPQDVVSRFWFAPNLGLVRGDSFEGTQIISRLEIRDATVN